MDVTKPNYYKEHSLDVIDMIKIWELNFNIGNVLKYIVRHNKKNDATQDLKKAREYIDREIEYLERK